MTTSRAAAQPSDEQVADDIMKAYLGQPTTSAATPEENLAAEIMALYQATKAAVAAGSSEEDKLVAAIMGTTEVTSAAAPTADEREPAAIVQQYLASKASKQ